MIQCGFGRSLMLLSDPKSFKRTDKDFYPVFDKSKTG